MYFDATTFSKKQQHGFLLRRCNILGEFSDFGV